MITRSMIQVPERYAMPEVVGQELSRARSAIESTNLAVGQVKEDWSESVEAGGLRRGGAEQFPS